MDIDREVYEIDSWASYKDWLLILKFSIVNSQLSIKIWGYSSVGRAPALQAGGHEFESHYLHHNLERG